MTDLYHLFIQYKFLLLYSENNVWAVKVLTFYNMLVVQLKQRAAKTQGFTQRDNSVILRL